MNILHIVALFGVLLSVTGCPLEPEHRCAKLHDAHSCKAIEVCEKPELEPCGHGHCEFPMICATINKPECKKVLALKKVCHEPKKKCVEIESHCGPKKCVGNTECVKKITCKKVLTPVLKHGRKLMYGPVEAHSKSAALTHEGDAEADADAKAESDKGPALAGAMAGALTGEGDAEADSKAEAEAGNGAPAAALAGSIASSGDGKAKASSSASAESKEEDEFKHHHHHHHPIHHGHGHGHVDDEKVKLLHFKGMKCNGECEHEIELEHEVGVVHKVGIEHHIIEYKEEVSCEEEFVCVPKPECKPVVVKKCVKAELKEGIDVCNGGFSFKYIHNHLIEKCGDEVCHPGFTCANVLIQPCLTPCGDDVCHPGFECSLDDKPECKEFEYLETICKDNHEPVCVPLPAHLIHAHKPECKTVMKCEIEEGSCGNHYCPHGFVCEVGMKPACHKLAVHHHRKHDDHDDHDDHEHKVYVVKHEEDDHKYGAHAKSYSKAKEDHTYTNSETYAVGDATALGKSKAETEDAGSLSLAASDGDDSTAKTHTEAYAKDGAKAGADADAVAFDH